MQTRTSLNSQEDTHDKQQLWPGSCDKCNIINIATCVLSTQPIAVDTFPEFGQRERGKAGQERAVAAWKHPE